MIPFNIIVAMDKERGIGKNGRLPWHLSADLKHFKEITTQTSIAFKKNCVIMGRKTWESLPLPSRPLPLRLNLILTRSENNQFPQGVLIAHDFNEAFELLESPKNKEMIEHIFVIGGEQIFNEAIKYPQCQTLFVTHLLDSYDCDCFFPVWEDQFKRVKTSLKQDEKGIRYFFAQYQRAV